MKGIASPNKPKDSQCQNIRKGSLFGHRRVLGFFGKYARGVNSHTTLASTSAVRGGSMPAHETIKTTCGCIFSQHVQHIGKAAERQVLHGAMKFAVCCKKQDARLLGPWRPIGADSFFFLSLCILLPPPPPSPLIHTCGIWWPVSL